MSFPHRRRLDTRWADNDVYGHLNNVQHYAFFDTVINAYLIEQGGLDIQAGAVIGVCAESHCTYHAPLAFPDTVIGALRVGNLGRSSVRYELALFRDGSDDPAAEGWFVHVFVDRETRRPAPIEGRLRDALEALGMTWADVVRAFDSEPDVVRGRGFAREVLKREGKIFAIDYAGAIVFKLPAERCSALVSDTTAVPFDRGQGKPLREWVVVSDPDAWLELAHEALALARARG